MTGFTLPGDKTPGTTPDAPLVTDSAAAECCPRCGTSIAGVSTRGPGDHTLDPCGCSVGSLTARRLAAGGCEP